MQCHNWSKNIVQWVLSSDLFPAPSGNRILSEQLIFNRRELIFNRRELIFISKKLLFISTEVIFISRELMFNSRELIFIKREFIFISRELIFTSKELILNIKELIFNIRELIFNSGDQYSSVWNRDLIFERHVQCYQTSFGLKYHNRHLIVHLGKEPN